MQYKYLVLCMFMQFFALSADSSMDNVAFAQNYTIRPATIDDKDAMVQVMLKSYAFYNYFIVAEDDEAMITQWLTKGLKDGLGSGFTFVLENNDGNDVNKIIAFLIMKRSSSPSRPHMLDTGNWAVDPDYREESLMVKLYTHLLQQIVKSHPEILRVEGEGTHAETIEIFKNAGFHQEGKLEKAIKLADGTYASQILFVWLNPNFKE